MIEEGASATPQTRPESRARDHLANERTFLAWVRTALGLIGIGFVLARMSLFLRQIAIVTGSSTGHESRGSHEFLITGVVFLMVGTAISLGAGRLYHRSSRAIEEGRYEPARHAVSALTAAVVLGGLAITGLVLWQLVGQGGSGNPIAP